MNNLASLTGRNLDQYTRHPWEARVLLYFIEIYIIFTQQYLVRLEYSYISQLYIIVNFKS